MKKHKTQDSNAFYRLIINQKKSLNLGSEDFLLHFYDPQMLYQVIWSHLNPVPPGNHTVYQLAKPEATDLTKVLNKI